MLYIQDFYPFWLVFLRIKITLKDKIYLEYVALIINVSLMLCKKLWKLADCTKAVAWQDFSPPLLWGNNGQ